VTVQEMCLFLAIIVWIGHDPKGTLKDYWSTLEQYFTAFYRNAMKRDRFYHIFGFLHFSHNKNELDKTCENFDRLWKIRAIVDKLSGSYAKYYSLTNHLAVDEIIVLFKGRVVVKHYISKKHKWCGLKLYKLCDFKGCTYSMTVYLNKDRKCVTPSMTAAHATVTGFTARNEHGKDTLYIDNFFSLQYCLMIYI